jgi:hypothetical protein
VLLVLSPDARADPSSDHPGAAIYREHCVRCHGVDGAGTAAVPHPLVGDRSSGQLAAYIDESMPEDDPTLVSGEDARRVAEFIHASFYAAPARHDDRTPRVELSRLTVRQHRNSLADLVGGFREAAPANEGIRGLRGEYFRGRDTDRRAFECERIDPQVAFDFGIESPDPERFEPSRFTIRWTGSVLPPETGLYEFVVRATDAVKFSVNTAAYEPPVIDATVSVNDDVAEHRLTVPLLGGRAYPLRLEFSKANQGVNDARHERPSRARIELSWRPPHGVLEAVPARCLLPRTGPPVFVPRTPFPPDDRSLGYERGSGVSPEWLAAATAAAAETADHVLEHVAQLARAPRDAPDRAARLQEFAAAFAERAFRRPLSPDLRRLVVERPFATAPDLDTGLKRSIMLALAAPRFLFREVDAAEAGDAFASAARLSFGLWDSLPDRPLREAAAAGRLATTAQLRAEAERMLGDPRTRAKLRDFLFAWLRVDHGPEIGKDPDRFPNFSPAVAADLRTSLTLLLDDVAWRDGDWRRLFAADEVPLNGRLAALYGGALPADADFRPLRLDEGRRGGVLTHPYLMSVLAHRDDTSPIQRGVFLARSVLGNVLKPPREAVPPLAAAERPDLSSRERVAVQTGGIACQSCHVMINPLGFALEDFDAIGRHREAERHGGDERPIDATGSYLPRSGPAATFRGGRELAAYVANSRDAQETFVQALFHALVKQPVRAWGTGTLEQLRAGFVAGEFDIHRLMVDIMVLAALPPRPDVSTAPSRPPEPQP